MTKLPKINELNRIYYEERRSTTDIAQTYGTTSTAVRLKLIRNGMKLRTLAEGQAIKANYLSPSKELIEYLEGLMLGDGGLAINRNRKSAFYRHTDKHREYIDYLQKKLIFLGLPCSEIKIREQKGRKYYIIQTPSYRDFVELYHKWYPMGKGLKSIPTDLVLSPIRLKNWYIGDGSWTKSFSYFDKTRNKIRRNCGKIILSIQNGIRGKKIMAEQMEKESIKNSLHKTAIYIKRESHEEFFKYILSDELEIPDGYQYKFPESAVC